MGRGGARLHMGMRALLNGMLLLLALQPSRLTHCRQLALMLGSQASSLCHQLGTQLALTLAAVQHRGLCRCLELRLLSNQEQTSVHRPLMLA